MKGDRYIMCDWCDPKLYESEYYGVYDFDKEQEIIGDDYIVLSMVWNSTTNKYGIHAGGEGEVVEEINFCPKCGRKLV